MVPPMSLGNQPSGEDAEILARTVFGEARGESLAGQIAVAFTVMHRARIARGWMEARGEAHPEFGNGSIASACQAPKQYSCWNLDSPTLSALKAVTLGDAAYQIALYVALAVINRLVSDALPDSTHYYNPARVSATPLWVTGRPAAPGQSAIKPARFIGSIGAHRFY